MPAGIESILALEVPVIVQIAERMMPVEDVVSMTPGAISSTSVLYLNR